MDKILKRLEGLEKSLASAREVFNRIKGTENIVYIHTIETTKEILEARVDELKWVIEALK